MILTSVYSYSFDTFLLYPNILSDITTMIDSIYFSNNNNKHLFEIEARCFHDYDRKCLSLKKRFIDNLLQENLSLKKTTLHFDASDVCVIKIIAYTYPFNY